MNFVLILLLLALGFAVLAYIRLPVLMTTVVAGLGLYAINKISGGGLSAVLMGLAWVGWGALVMLNFSALRERFLSAPMLAFFRRAMPPMSSTERDALDAGTVWWDAELFSGEPNWERLLSLPMGQLSKEEQAFLDGPVEQLCEMANEWEIGTELGDLPPAMWRHIKDKGFLGIIIPKKYGGLEFSAQAHSAIMTKLASRSGTTAVCCMVPNSLGPAELLHRYGTEAQCDHYLPRLASGEEIPCFALTNPYAGSDAANIPDYGIVCEGEYNGEKVLGMRVTWEKRYITLAPVATLLGLAFQLYDPDGLLGGDEDVGITLALVPTDHKGVEIGRRHWPARQPFQNGPNSGKDVFIPMDWVIGGQERCGDGWRMLMNCLAAGRSISLPASSTGAMKVATRSTAIYAGLRRQFNLPLHRFEGVQEAMARIAGNTYLIDAARRLTAAALDQGEEPAVLSAVLKYQATERMRQTVNDAMDIHGGRAICEGPSNYLFHPYMAAPVAITVEGANILTRSLIVFGQGAIRCHPWLLKEIHAAEETHPDVALTRFDRALMGHIGHVMSTSVRTVTRNLFGGLTGSDPSVAEPNYWYGQLERNAASFALVAEFALAQLGGGLKRREMLSARFADILSELYLSSAALKHFENRGQPASELVVLNYALRNSLYTVQQRLDEILANLPGRVIAWVLRRMVFPYGRRWRAPGDSEISALATAMVESDELLDTLSDGMYRNNQADDVLGCLEYARGLATAATPLIKRVREAQASGVLKAYEDDVPAAAVAAEVLSETEGEQLRQFDQALRRVIDVDDFDPAELYTAAADDATHANAA